MTQRGFDVYDILTWTLLDCIIKDIISTNACTEPGWVGPNCRYKCRCLRECSQMTGECEANDTCSKHYFGDACQYEDLTKEVTQTETILTDSDDSTCKIVDRASILIMPTAITMFRIVAKDEESIDKITYVLRSGVKDVDCDSDSFQAKVNPNTKDHFCYSAGIVTEIIIIGNGDPTVCSVNVNGGRNLALRQEVYTSTDLTPDLKGAGVDGVYPLGNETMMNTTSCYSAKESEINSYYQVILHMPLMLYYFVIINRPEAALRANLNGYTLYSYDKFNNIKLTYHDANDTGRLVHRIVNPDPVTWVSMFKLEKNRTGASSHPLEFCELKATGECPPGFHGLDCSIKCDGRCVNQSCYLLGQCFRCPSGVFGRTCSEICSGNCVNRSCEQTTARCLKGCKPGYVTPQCTKECDQGFYGIDCKMRCDGNCKKCFHVDGTCQECHIKKFGKLCSLDCSIDCAGDGACDKSSGNCSSGCKPGTVCAPPDVTVTDGACSENCGGNKTCHPETGKCNEGCISGFGGYNCSTACSKNCGGNKTCHPQTGKCNEGCISGFGGFNCSTECSSNCVDGDCEMDSLKCTKSTKNEDTGREFGALFIVVTILTLLIIGFAAMFALARRRIRLPPGVDEID